MLSSRKPRTLSKRSHAGVIALSLSMLAGCASTKAVQPEPVAAGTGAHANTGEHEHGQQQGMMGGMCPMKVPGTAVSVADTEGGVALVFTTSTGDVAELRRRVHQVAEMHNRHHSGGMMSGGMHDGGTGEHPMGRGGGMMSPGMMIGSAATAEDVEGGARIVLAPKDPSQLDALRRHVHGHAERMSHGECPMMVMQGHAVPGEDGR